MKEVIPFLLRIKYSSNFELLTRQKAMNGRKILDFILKYSIVLILLFPIVWFWYIMLYWGWFWMSSEVPWNRLTETYLTIWDYSIWKQKWLYNVCHKDKAIWCLNWELLWVKIINDNEVYIYFKLNYWTVKSYDSTKILKYYYNSYRQSQRIYIDNINLIPKYWILSSTDLKLYSEWDLDKLSSDKKEAFKELEKNPTIIIDGVNRVH